MTGNYHEKRQLGLIAYLLVVFLGGGFLGCGETESTWYVGH
jgi:hypothetical protein